MAKNVVIIYGNGGDMDFGVFANSLKNKLFMPAPGSRPSTTPTVKVAVQKTTKAVPFLQYLVDRPGSEPIDELHVFSHSVGAALSLGYGDDAIGISREKMKADSIKRGLRVWYARSSGYRIRYSLYR